MIGNLKIMRSAALLLSLSAFVTAACAIGNQSSAVANEDKTYKGDKLQSPAQILSGFVHDLAASPHIPDTNVLNKKYKFRLRPMTDGSHATQDISHLKIFLGNFISDATSSNTRRLEFEFDVMQQNGQNGPPFALPVGWLPAGGYSPNSTRDKPEPNLCLLYANSFGLHMLVCPSLFNSITRIVFSDEDTALISPSPNPLP